MTAPTRREVVFDYLAALTDEELESTIAEARADTSATARRTTRSAHRKENPHASRH